MNSNPKVSLIMPNYNYGHYLKDAIESAVKQTYTSFELIIIDDASTDNSLDIISPYVKKYPFIHLIKHQENQGVIKTFQKGVEKAQGEYIAALPSDDILFSNFLTQKVKVLDENPDLGLCCSKYAYFQSKTPQEIYSIDLLKSEKNLYLSPQDLIKKIKSKNSGFLGTPL